MGCSVLGSPTQEATVHPEPSPLNPMPPRRPISWRPQLLRAAPSRCWDSEGILRREKWASPRYCGAWARKWNTIPMASPCTVVGKLYGLDADMDLMSDTGMTLAVLALFAKGTTTIRNIGNWRVKETDRIHAMATELRKVGADVEEGTNSLKIHPPLALRMAEIETYEDHRMAMCFSLLSLGGVGVLNCADPGCVRKVTYPGYFDDFLAIGRNMKNASGLTGGRSARGCNDICCIACLIGILGVVFRALSGIPRKKPGILNLPHCCCRSCRTSHVKSQFGKNVGGNIGGSVGLAIYSIRDQRFEAEWNDSEQF